MLFWIVALSLFRWPSAGPCFNCPSSDSGFRVICCHVLALPVSPAPESPSSCGSSQGPRNCRAEPGRARWTDRGNMDGSERSSDTADESEAEQNNRNLNDLLQELRVADLGVQLLFGLLLGLPFTVRFSRLDGSGQNPLSSQPDLRCIGHGAVGEPCRLPLLGVPSTRKGAVTRFRQRAGHSRVGMVAVAASAAIWMVMLFVGLSWPVGFFAGIATGSLPALWFVFPIVDRLGAITGLGERSRRPSLTRLFRPNHFGYRPQCRRVRPTVGHRRNTRRHSRRGAPNGNVSTSTSRVA